MAFDAAMAGASAEGAGASADVSTEAARASEQAAEEAITRAEKLVINTAPRGGREIDGQIIQISQLFGSEGSGRVRSMYCTD